MSTELIKVEEFSNAVPDDVFKKIVALVRIAVPYTGIIISTRESQKIRGEALELGVSQVSAVSRKMLDDIKKSLKDYLPTVRAEKNVSMVFVMLTDIFEETTELIYDGDYSGNVVRVAFNDSKDLPEKILLKDVVSRKKQLIPPIIQAVQALDM